jgi:hypothetical protein
MRKTGYSEEAYAANDGGIAMAMGELMLAHLSVLQHADGSRLHETDT